MRNATVMAIAPNANIGLIAHTSPGIDPRFANIFSRATDKGKFIEINRNLVEDLKALGLWKKVREDVLRYQGDISQIDIIPEKIKAVYRTSFDISPSAYIEVAARAQKWVDQAMSRNIYLASREVEVAMNIYIDAWRKGLKTTYYCHVKQRHTAEQVTTRVNKSEGISGGKKFGFGRQSKASSNVPESIENTTPLIVVQEMSQEVSTCPVDPMERLECDSCQ